MGIAASQARYLYLTARQTNVEFEGQQINQSRTNLANEQAGLFNKMLEIKAPKVKTLYEVSEELKNIQANKVKKDETTGEYFVDPEQYPLKDKDPQYQYDYSIWEKSNHGKDANAAYDYVVQQYQQEKTDYEKAIDEINLKSQQIQQQDQVLELQLRQLDTEQETIVNELESVKKVLDKNIDKVFKTFQD